MKAAQPKRKPAGKGRGTILELQPSAHVLSILSDFQKRYLRDPLATQANAAHVLISLALMDYERTMARARQVEKYCTAEGIESQDEYRAAFLNRKFPRGRLPRQKAAR